MKNILAIILIAILICIPLSFTHAQFGDALKNLNDAVGETSGTGLSSDLAGSIGTVVKGILALVGTIFFLLTIYAGILWMTARGDEGKVEKAVDIIRASIIGLAITLSAYAITYFVTNRLSSGTSSNGPAPLGCCVGSGDAPVCAANVDKNSCDLNKATWNVGACPDKCVK